MSLDLGSLGARAPRPHTLPDPFLRFTSSWGPCLPHCLQPAHVCVDIPFAHRPRAEVQALRRLTCCLHLPLGVPGGLEPTASAVGSPALERESIRKLVPQLCISNPGTMPPPHSAEHRQETKGKSKPSHQHRKSVGVRGSYSRAGGQVNTVAPPCG